MQAFSFIHCADLHLGAPFQGLADLPANLALRLRAAPMQALDRIVETALERRVTAVIMAGDVFDAADRNLQAQIRLRNALRKLDAGGILTLIAAGNHDPLGSAVASIRYPASVHFFDRRVESVPLQRDGVVVGRVYGISHDGPGVTENLARRFPEVPAGPFSIAVLHANLGRAREHGSYAPCSLADLEARGFDYWALGHLHTRGTPRAERPVVHYPGNPQGLHMGEVGPRGATLVEVSATGAVALSPIWTDAVRWHRARTSIAELKTVDDLLDAFADIGARKAAEAPDRLHIVLWTLTGSGRLHETLRRHDVVADLVRSLRRSHAPEPVAGAVWVQRLAVETRPRRDTEALRRQQDLLGDLLRLAADARAHPPETRRREVGDALDLEEPHPVTSAIQEELAGLLDVPRLRAVMRHDPWSTLDWPRLLRRAEVLAIEGLLGEDEGE